MPGFVSWPNKIADQSYEYQETPRTESLGWTIEQNPTVVLKASRTFLTHTFMVCCVCGRIYRSHHFDADSFSCIEERRVELAGLMIASQCIVACLVGMSVFNQIPSRCFCKRLMTLQTHSYTAWNSRILNLRTIFRCGYRLDSHLFLS